MGIQTSKSLRVFRNKINTTRIKIFHSNKNTPKYFPRNNFLCVRIEKDDTHITDQGFSDFKLNENEFFLYIHNHSDILPG